MCRLFGFRSVIQSQVHQSLVSADNALETQSHRHPHGWGVAYYVAGSPHLIKSERSALNDSIFKKVSGVVSSQTVLAHVRKATLGKVDILNTHPFQYGPWVFAHNGNIKNFADCKDEILAAINPHFKRFILGETDSELIFFYLLSFLTKKCDLLERDYPIDIAFSAINEALTNLAQITGPINFDNTGPDTETYITFILTNGSMMVAHGGGKDLYYSTYKKRCGERDTCPSFSKECESAANNGSTVNHLIFASEPLQGENIWLKLSSGELVGVDASMKLKSSHEIK